jgi:ABC-type phosphate/phosphonate transport system permease subunit
MTIANWNNDLLLVALVLLIVVLVYALVILVRANRTMARLDHMSDTFVTFAEKLIPAVLNIGTITTAVQALLQTLPHHKSEKGEK